MEEVSEVLALIIILLFKLIFKGFSKFSKKGRLKKITIESVQNRNKELEVLNTLHRDRIREQSEKISLLEKEKIAKGGLKGHLIPILCQLVQ